jgi:capsular polysaccharide biosynthesis protein
LRFFINGLLYKHHNRIDYEVFWVTDIWSRTYFHWITDTLPRIFVIQDHLCDATLLLPCDYQKEEYIRSSLMPFGIREVMFICKPTRCKSVFIPSHTALSGNFNEDIIRGLRTFYTDYYNKAHNNTLGNKIYISRSKAQTRKIKNEEEVISVLSSYGFITVFFEDISFDQQVRIAINTKYLISNHGAGLTNILFMKAGSSVFELRRSGDILNNCYFALASALDIRYFYQICDSEKFDEDASTANLVVDCDILKKNLELMLNPVT